MSGSSQFIGRRSARTTERGYSTVFFTIFSSAKGLMPINMHYHYLIALLLKQTAMRCVSLLAIPTRAAAFSPAAIYFEPHSAILVSLSASGNSIPRELCFNLVRLRLIVTSKLCTFTYRGNNLHSGLNIFLNHIYLFKLEAIFGVYLVYL